MINLEKFKILPSNTILMALKRIDSNRSGFLIVVDENDKVLGTLTDGDIRRALITLINYKSLQDSIREIYRDNFSFVTLRSSFEEVIEKFKSPRINFLPILDDESKLINIITKKQLHVFLLEDRQFDHYFDFQSLDHTVLEHEIYNKPWGFYKTTFLNDHVRVKIIKVYPNEELSLQEHKKREEHWIVIKGTAILTIGETIKNINPGDYIFIPKGCKHKVYNDSLNETLVLSEVQLGEYFGEDDIIRHEDKYGRN